MRVDNNLIRKFFNMLNIQIIITIIIIIIIIIGVLWMVRKIMMLSIFVLILGLFSTLVIAAEGDEDTVNWNFTTDDFDEVNDMIVDNGGIYVTGRSKSNLDIASSGWNTLVVKYGTDGNKLWNYTHSFATISKNEKGKFLITTNYGNGGSDDLIIFGADISDYHSSDSEWDAYIGILNASNGEEIHNFTYGEGVYATEDDNIWGGSISVDADAFYLAFTEYLDANTDDLVIKKYNLTNYSEITSGWDKKLTSNVGLFPLDIATTIDGDVFVSYYDTNDMRLKKYSSAGVEDTANWNFTLTADNSVVSEDIYLDTTNEKAYFLYKNKTSTLDQDWGLAVYSFAGVKDNSWTSDFGYDGSYSEPHSIVGDSDRIYISGLDNSSYTDDWVHRLLAYDLDANLVDGWNKTFDQTSSYTQAYSHLALKSGVPPYLYWVIDQSNTAGENVTFKEFEGGVAAAEAESVPEWSDLGYVLILTIVSAGFFLMRRDEEEGEE